MLISITQFTGMSPKNAPRLLGQTDAQTAYDTKLSSGSLRPFASDTRESVFTSEVPRSIFKYTRADESVQWLYATTDVDFAPSPIADNTNRRVYTTGIGTKLCAFDSNTLLATAQSVTSSATVTVGIERPATPTLSIGGTGTGQVEARAYTICYVRTWSDGKDDIGVLSAPATNGTKTTIDVLPGQTVTVSGIKKPTDLTSKCTKIRVYRSAVTSTGDATFRFVTEFPIDHTQALPAGVTWNAGTSSFTFVDSVAGVNLGETSESDLWTAPVEGLTGLVSLSNGVFAAFKDKTVYFCEPYQVHAWPSEYSVTVDYDIIGLGCFGNSVVACTKGKPFILTVGDPSTVVARPIQEHAPCLSKNSIASVNGAVVYATANGLVSVDTTAPLLITRKVLTKDEWKWFNPGTLNGVFYNNMYYGFYEPFAGNSGGGLIIDTAVVSGNLVRLSRYCTAVYVDPRTDYLYLSYFDEALNAYAVYRFDSGLDGRRRYRWKSKVFTSNQGLGTFSAARVDFYDTINSASSTYTEQVESNAWNAPAVNLYPINGTNLDKYYIARRFAGTTFNYYVDGELKFTKTVTASTPFRLPSGFRGHTYEVEILSARPIARVQLASSIRELG